jgi:hypothetical protein
VIEYDEYGRPIPARDPFLDMMMKPFEQQQPVAPAPPLPPQPEAVPPIPGARGRSTNPVLAASGISTEGPLADQAAQNAQNYQSGVDQYEDAVGQGQPQVYGQEEPMGNAQGPLTPQETANAMPQTQDAMKKLIDQHMLRGATPSQQQHYDNYVQGSREKRAAEKAFLRSQAPGGGTGYRGSDGMSTGGGMAGGPRVFREGGYTFVRGTMRPADAMENAKIANVNANTEYMRERPEIAREGYGLRRDIAGQANETRRDIAGQNNETRREVGAANNAARETVATMNNQTRRDLAKINLDADLQKIADKEVKENIIEMEKSIQELRRRAGAAGEKVPYKSGWFGGGPKRDENAYQGELDIDFSQVDPATKKPGVKNQGSYRVIEADALRRLDALRKMAQEKRWSGDLPNELVDLIEELELGAGRTTDRLKQSAQ